VRYDLQDGENLPATAEANGGFPEVMPAIEFPGNDGGGFDWETLSPRLGVTYALGQERKTLLRGSLSRFPNALFQEIPERANPLASQYAAILFLDDPGGFSAFYDAGEEFAVRGGLLGFDPENPTSLSTANINDPNLTTTEVTELILGVEHAFLPEFVTGLSLTWRRNGSIWEIQRLFEDLETGEIRTVGRNDYLVDGDVQGVLPDDTPYSWEAYSARPGLRPTGGTFWTAGDREIESFAAAVTFTKRLSNRWMARGFFNYLFRDDWNVPESFFDNNDPNRRSATVLDGASNTFEGLHSKWQWNLNGMYQVAPERAWGFNVAANLSGRQGYPIEYFHPFKGSIDGISRRILAPESPTQFRYDDIFIADLRLEKEFAASENTSLTFSLDAFNIFNEGTVLSRNLNLRSDSANWVTSTLSPRVFRLGVRLNWR